MHNKQLSRHLPIESEESLLTFWNEVLYLRESDKTLSESLAIDAVSGAAEYLSHHPNPVLRTIQFSFGRLEVPSDAQNDSLWHEIRSLIDIIKKAPS